MALFSSEILALYKSLNFLHSCIISDIRDLISVDDAMEDEVLQMGPNGGLIFCMEFVFYDFSHFTYLLSSQPYMLCSTGITCLYTLLSFTCLKVKRLKVIYSCY